MRSSAGRLRDKFTKEQLEEELRNYDDQAEVWLHPRRGFGFVTVQDDVKANELIECSPLAILNVEIELHKAHQMPADLFTELATTAAEVSWSTYYTSPRLRQELQSIIDNMDATVVERMAEVRLALRGTSEERCGLGVVLFSGPPGVGKTHAMKLLASEAKTKAWVVSANKLVADLDACQRATQYIQRMDGICMIDEAEVLFPPRSALMGYQSVMAKTHNMVVNHFLEVIDGMLSAPHRPGRMVILASNLPDTMDEGFRSRIRVEVTFELPTAKQCNEYWRNNARHLNGRAWFVLGRVSQACSLSFRDMDHIAEQLVQSKAGGSDAGLREYLIAISGVVGSKWPSASDVVKRAPGALYRSSLAAGSATFAARSVAEFGQRLRARL